MSRSYRATRAIDASRATVWSLLADSSTYADWNDAVVSIDGPIQQGETISLVSVVAPKRTFTLEVTTLDEPERMVWRDGMPFRLFTGVRTYTLTDRPGEGCTFTMLEEFTGPLAGLITRAIPDLTDSFETFADCLKAAAEVRQRR